MDTLKNKQFLSFDYTSRYATVPVYYDTLAKKYMMGIGTSVNKSTDYFLYSTQQGDNLDLLALKFYNNPTLWWVIAYFNSFIDAFSELKPDTVIKIPAIASLEFGADR